MIITIITLEIHCIYNLHFQYDELPQVKRERGFRVQSKHKTISSGEKGANTFLLSDELIGSVDLGPKMCGVSTFINHIFVVVCILIVN